MSSAPPLPGGAFFYSKKWDGQRLPTGGECFHCSHHGSALSFGGLCVAVELERGRRNSRFFVITQPRAPSVGCARNEDRIDHRVGHEAEGLFTVARVPRLERRARLVLLADFTEHLVLLRDAHISGPLRAQLPATGLLVRIDAADDPA